MDARSEGEALVAQVSDIEKQLDDLYLSSPADLNSEGMEDVKFPRHSGRANEWLIDGFLEHSIQFSRKQSKVEKYSNPIFWESRARINFEYPSSTFGFFTSIDGHLVHREWQKDIKGEQGFAIERNNGYFEVNEFYFERRFSQTNIRLGKQLFSWGTGDLFQVSNYFDQADLRQLFAVFPDDRLRGTLALSIKQHRNDYAFEAVISPSYAFPLFPYRDSYWAIELAPENDIDFQFDNPTQPQSVYRNTPNVDRASIAVRAGGVFGSFDAHVSLYHGLSTLPLFRPKLTGEIIFLDDMVVPKPTLFFSLYTDRVNTLGFDYSASKGPFTFRLEGAFTPDQIAVVEPSEVDISEEIMRQIIAYPMPPALQTIFLDSDFTQTTREPYVSWVLGADYNYRGANGFLLVEWLKGRYVEHRRNKLRPLFDDVLYLRWQDKFLNESLVYELSVLLSPRNGKFGSSTNLKIGWDFKNGLTTNYEIFIFEDGGEDILFEQVSQKDLFKLSVKFEF